MGRTSMLSVTLSSSMGGTDRSLFSLAPVLEGHGIDIALAAPAAGEPARRWKERGGTLVPLDLPPRHGFRCAETGRYLGLVKLLQQGSRSAGSTAGFARMLRPYDIVHSNWLMTHIDSAVAGRIARRPVVLELHDIVPEGIGRRALDAATRAATGAIAVSTAVQDQLGLEARKRTTLIPQGVDTRRFAPGPPDHALRALLSARPESFLIGAIGRFDPEKGLLELIEATRILIDSGIDASLVLIGWSSKDGGGYHAQLRRRAADLLGDRCRILGPTEDVPGILRQLDVLACPSHAEPFGLIALEAQASGIPVVASDAGGLRDFIATGSTGLACPPRDPPALARALQLIHGQPRLRDSLVVNALAQARERYSIEARGAAFAELIHRLARTGTIDHVNGEAS
ncbi:glycosyltransferase family 4 protein [Lolliginicoccus levis]|uniref:glycosyltransferase family 4 protein n=1 Tax=Lolliginicoccus levis TaxID=2919542 RepID=UPI00241EF500|nr:glycosyltransferase family 4 protein [Lolliginicoccus levis]